jgi:homoserine O-acetyltransferase/O-succinyltransferase
MLTDTDKTQNINHNIYTKMDDKSVKPDQPSAYSHLVEGQSIATIPSFELDSGVLLKDAPVAYKTWGKLNEDGTNCMVLCHALSGSADAAEWWGPLFGKGKPFDTSLFFIFCGNVLGSPYGSASPCTKDPETGMLV